jgi:hypothetical protein
MTGKHCSIFLRQQTDVSRQCSTWLMLTLSESGSWFYPVRSPASQWLAWSLSGDQLPVWATVDCLLTGGAPPNCYSDLYLFDLTRIAEEGYATATRLTDSQLTYDQVTELHWFRR